MRTVDAVELLARRVKESLKRYPEGALTPRTVVYECEASEERALSLNRRITAAIHRALKNGRSLTAAELVKACQEELKPTFKEFLDARCQGSSCQRSAALES